MDLDVERIGNEQGHGRGQPTQPGQAERGTIAVEPSLDARPINAAQVTKPSAVEQAMSGTSLFRFRQISGYAKYFP
jgi:hypothetical protein